MAQGPRGQIDGGRGSARDAGRVAAASCTAVVPAYLAGSTLERTLTSLLIDNAAAIERVIVVVSPGDRSADVARALGERAAVASRLEVVEAGERLTAGRARNLGRARAPHAELLLFVDADCRLPAHGVGRLVAALEREGHAAVGASITSSGRPRPLAWLGHLLEFKDADVGAARSTGWLVPSAAMLCRADAFDRVGGFPDLWPGEDWVLCERLRRRGLAVRRTDEVIVDHLHPPGWRRLFAHQYRLGSTSAQARAMTGMRGVVFVRRPWLAPLLVLGRLARGTGWMLSTRPRELPLFILLFPLYVAGLATWTIGFTAGALRAR